MSELIYRDGRADELAAELLAIRAQYGAARVVYLHEDKAAGTYSICLEVDS
ncbi:hypothetical protein [Streptosporangium saharense]|uniref:hypothetical protein n=1 Tax=Streptosporangium saharense TaxID=1706840 RepID=UPI00332D2390